MFKIKHCTSWPIYVDRFGLQRLIITLLAMHEIKNLMSSWVGQLFWHGASAHFKHLAASFRAPLSLKVVCLMSSKFLYRLDSLVQDLGKKTNIINIAIIYLSLNRGVARVGGPYSKVPPRPPLEGAPQMNVLIFFSIKYYILCHCHVVFLFT